MTTNTSATDRDDDRDAPWWGLRVLLQALALLALGGCSFVNPHRQDIDHPANPLSDQQTRDQVIEPAKQIAQYAQLQDPAGRFDYSSCNDQGDPPYRGVVSMSFTLPNGQTDGPPSTADPNTSFQRIAATMVAHGWNDGPPPDWHSYGRVLNKDGVVAVMTQDPASGRGKLQLYGECRNMTNHRLDGPDAGFRIDDQLRSG
ncbi:hypothetical protein [Mycobacterium sp. E2238]|uniref:hypothetical protein n=1 Tax=Mycobacterium sp. E2238 TaxID=1834131 RepID=UPI001E32BCCE|nr:hypothetical protein [Mycobacterium sp. E2238]